MHHYLFHEKSNPENFVLKQFFGFSFEDLHAENYELRVILPEGSENIIPELPFEVDSVNQERTFSYLDIVGRPTVVIEKKNVMKFHNQEFSINYTFNHQNILIEPLLIFAVYLGFFLLLVIAGRFEYKSEDKSKLE